jgi:hypothetical protein
MMGSGIFPPEPSRKHARALAEYNSAIRQIENLRYEAAALMRQRDTDLCRYRSAELALHTGALHRLGLSL